MFRKILIANRGEIAVRIARACRELGIGSVAVYSEADRDAVHVAAADEAVCIGPPPSRQSYLDVTSILQAAVRTDADAIHPGYGFLSENAAFARAASRAGLAFVGPSPVAIAAMGDKTAARGVATSAGVPVVPAIEELPSGASELRAAAAELGFPVLLKAAAGGGGKGMRVAHSADELERFLDTARAEAKAAFGDDRIYAERYIQRPRHVEMQVLADRHGNCVHLGERECSIQRRHQKIIEEAPSPGIDDAQRARLAAAACALARQVHYATVGTVEFLVDEAGEFYFLEMNTRLQVEHAVTEAVWGVDLVQAQIRTAAGEPLWLRQDELSARGHAIECRVYAEDPAAGFLPSAGTISELTWPLGPGVRVDAGVAAGSRVPVHYDPLLAKITVHAGERRAACARMRVALEETRVEGVATNIQLLKDVIAHRAFATGATHTAFLTEYADLMKPAQTPVAPRKSVHVSTGELYPALEGEQPAGRGAIAPDVGVQSNPTDGRDESEQKRTETSQDARPGERR
jgi:acetyl-CoA carboxylase biotin carboxylase subunit